MTISPHSSERELPDITTPQWSAIFAIALSIASLITAEQLPASLLTPMADGLGVSEGVAGQTVSVTAFFAILSSLFVTTLTRGIDRRYVVMGCVALMMLSSLLVAAGIGLAAVLLGRALLGLAVGGLWSMAASLTMRLVPPKDVPKALSIVFGGVSMALVVSAPLGSFLGALIGWRGVFMFAALLSLLCLIWQAITLPSLPARRRGGVGAAFALLGRDGVALAMLAMFIVFASQFAFFNYVRPFFEDVTGFGVNGVSMALLIIGISNFVGTSLSSVALRSSLKLTLVLAPLVLAVCTAGLVLFGALPGAVLVLITVWGFATGLVPVAWSNWVTRNLRHDAEDAGGLQVVVIQFAAMFGASVGGLAFNLIGPTGPAFLCAALLALSVVLISVGVSGRQQ